MSQGPWKINERSFLHQITFIYYASFLLKTQTPHRSLGPGLERGMGCWEREGRGSQSSAGCGFMTRSGSRWEKGQPWDSALGRAQFWASVELPRDQEQLLDPSRPVRALVSSSVNLCL